MRGAARNYPLQLWDAALVFLVFASIGAWGLAIITRLRIEDPLWSLAMTHIFLDTFSYGWFLLGVLSAAYLKRPYLDGNPLASWSINLAAIGIPVLFLLSMSPHVVPLPFYFLTLTAVTLVATGIPAVAHWAAASGVRVLHLQWMLLGFVTLRLVTGA